MLKLIPVLSFLISTSIHAKKVDVFYQETNITEVNLSYKSSNNSLWVHPLALDGKDQKVR